MKDYSEKDKSAQLTDCAEDGRKLELQAPGIHAAASYINEEISQLPLWGEYPEAQGEARLRRALDVEAIGVIYLDMTGRIVDANNAFLAMSLYSREELEAGKLDWQRLTPREFLACSRQAFAELQERGETDVGEN